MSKTDITNDAPIKTLVVENFFNKLRCDAFMHIWREEASVAERQRFHVYYNDGNYDHYVGEYLLVQLWSKPLEEMNQFESYLSVGLNAHTLKHKAGNRNPYVFIGTLVKIDAV